MKYRCEDSGRSLSRGDDDAVTSWLKDGVRAIKLCLEANLPEAATSLIYAGIDTLGMLNAPAEPARRQQGFVYHLVGAIHCPFASYDRR